MRCVRAHLTVAQSVPYFLIGCIFIHLILNHPNRISICLYVCDCLFVMSAGSSFSPCNRLSTLNRLLLTLNGLTFVQKDQQCLNCEMKKGIRVRKHSSS
jgi:hypothetical protein